MSKQRNLRVKHDVSEDDTTGDEPECSRSKMEDTKLLQKLRKRAVGLAASTLLTGALSGAEDLGSSGGLVISEHTELMAAYVKAKAVTSTEEDPHMKKFIEDQLAARLGRGSEDDEEEDEEALAAAKRRKQEEELYAVPEELKTNLVSDNVMAGSGTGITEVPLSVAHRMHNIEQTEAMKRKMLAGATRKQAAAGVNADEQFGMGGAGSGSGRKGDMVVQRGMFVPIFGKDLRSGKDKNEKAQDKQATNKRMITERSNLRPPSKR